MRAMPDDWIAAFAIFLFVFYQLLQTRPSRWYDIQKRYVTGVPPSSVFPIVWFILYLAISIAIYLYWRDHFTNLGFIAITANLVLQKAWTPLFFGSRSINATLQGIAAFLLLAILATALWVLVIFAREAAVASAVLWGFYVAWLAYALYLNVAFAFSARRAARAVARASADQSVLLAQTRVAP